jgi:hypothetical protein
MPITTDSSPIAGPRTKTVASQVGSMTIRASCLAGEQLRGRDRRGDHGLEAARLLLAHDRVRGDGQRDRRRHQQEEQERLLKTERVGDLPRAQAGPLRPGRDEVRDHVRRQRVPGPECGDQDRDRDEEDGREDDRRQQRSVADDLEQLAANDREDHGRADHDGAPFTVGAMPRTSK